VLGGAAVFVAATLFAIFLPVLIARREADDFQAVSPSFRRDLWITARSVSLRIGALLVALIAIGVVLTHL
jgi:hypothetical protein